MKSLAVVAAFGIFAGPAWAQEGGDELTPAGALEILEEARALMQKAEERLHRSSAPGEAERGALERIEKLVKEAESKERGAADKLGELIRKARRAEGPSRASRNPGDRRDRSPARSGRSQAPPKGAVDPRRAEGPSKFRSSNVHSGSWGHLPPHLLRAMLSAGREDVAPEFQERWKKYREALEQAAK